MDFWYSEQYHCVRGKRSDQSKLLQKLSSLQLVARTQDTAHFRLWFEPDMSIFKKYSSLDCQRCLYFCDSAVAGLFRVLFCALPCILLG